MTFKKAFIAISIVIGFHAILLIVNGYWLFSWIDMPMHFSGGFVMAMLGFAIWKKGVGSIKLENWFKILFILGFVSFISVIWEWHEFLLDTWLSSGIEKIYSTRQPGLADTMSDFAFDIIGSVVAWFTYKK